MRRFFVRRAMRGFFVKLLVKFFVSIACYSPIATIFGTLLPIN